MFVITAIALIGLVIFSRWPRSRCSTRPTSPTSPPTDAVGASELLPFGLLGIWAAVPFAIWFFLAVEGVPLAAEEAREPERDVPRGIVASMADPGRDRRGGAGALDRRDRRGGTL